MLKIKRVTLEYPGCNDNPDAIEVGLMHVRAADSILIEYDFDRDGWKISQAKVHEWPGDDPICDPVWTETAFVQAWPFE